MSDDTVTVPRSSLCTRCQSRPRRGPRQRWCRECRALAQRLAREQKQKTKTTQGTDALRNAPPAPTVCGVSANTTPVREEKSALDSPQRGKP